MLYINTFIHTILPNTPTWHSFLQKYPDDTISLERYGFSVKGVCLMLAQLHRRSSMIHTQSHQFMKAYLTWSACVYCTPNIIYNPLRYHIDNNHIGPKGMSWWGYEVWKKTLTAPFTERQRVGCCWFPKHKPADRLLYAKISLNSHSIHIVLSVWV